jgi:sulfonate transport system permease protein
MVADALETSMSRLGKSTFAPSGWRGLVLPVVLLLIWQWASQQSEVAAYIFAPLPRIWETFVQLLASGELWANLQVSLLRTCTGLTIGITIGMFTGTLMAVSRLADRLIGPLYHALRQVPLLGLVPLIGLWFGGGDPSKLLVVILASFYPTLLNTYEGLRQADKRFLEVGFLLKFGPIRNFTQVLLPSALPSIITGISLALAFSWLASMGAELLFTLGPGIGAMLLNGQTAGSMEVVIVCVMTIALIGYAMNAGFRRLTGYLTPWANRS